VNKLVKYYEIIKPYLSDNKKNEQQYIRQKGVYIKYTDNIKYPDFVLQNCKVNGNSKDVSFDMRVKNISSNQLLFNKKGDVSISSKSKYYKSAIFDAEYLNHVDFSFFMKELYFDDLNIDALILKNVKINIESKGTLKKDKFKILSKVIVLPEVINFDGNKYIAKIIKSLKNFDLNIKIFGTVSKYNISINSEIDKKLSGYLKKEMENEIKNSKVRLKKVLDQKVSDEISKTGFNVKEFKVIDNLNSFDTSLGSIKDSLNKYSKDELKKFFLKKGIRNFIKF